LSRETKKYVFFTWPLLVFLVITLAAVAFGSLDINWQGWERATCWGDKCFCESPRQGTVAQPSNTYSNLSYVLVGLWIIDTARRYPLWNFSRWAIDSLQSGLSYHRMPGEAHNLMDSRRIYPLLYGISVVTTGLGSLFYHASLTIVGQWFDLMGMFLLVSFIVLYNLARLARLSHKGFFVAYIALNAGLGFIQFIIPEIGGQVFAVLLVIGLVIEILYMIIRRPRFSGGYLYAATATFTSAYIIWNLDYYGILCSPYSILQGHAAWHLLTAVAAGLLFLHYRSETGQQREIPSAGSTQSS